MAGLSFLQPIVRRSAAKVKNYLPSSFKDALALDQGATLEPFCRQWHVLALREISPPLKWCDMPFPARYESTDAE